MPFDLGYGAVAARSYSRLEVDGLVRMQVVEKVGYIMGYARSPTRHLGGSGGMLPKENF